MSSGSEIYAVIEMSKVSKIMGPTVRVAAQAIVLRVESWMDGTYGYAVRFSKHQIF